MNKQANTTLLCIIASVLIHSTAHAQDKEYAPASKHPTRVYFGDPHIHTRLSVDASLWGNNLSVEDTYRFGLGEEVTSNKGWKVKLARPLDWMVISDHSDGWGFYQLLQDGDDFALSHPLGVKWHEMLKEGKLKQVADEFIKTFGEEKLPWDVSDPKLISPGWRDTVEATEKFNDPGTFTAFIAYEWTSNPDGDNLHRVVIYRDNADKTKDVLPFTTIGSRGKQDPEELWKVLAAYEQKTGGQVMAIPHNGNWSSGLMFAETTFGTKKPFDKAYVVARNRWEPLYETTQIKGDGEAHPFLSPDDEFADYETWDVGNLAFNRAVTKEMLPGSYARSALKLGLKYQEKFGVNPFQFGLVGAGDSHTGLPGQEENNFMGKSASSEPDAERWKTPFRVAEIGTQEGWSEVASGLTGIWATENTRASLWDAMKRKEVYATTGTRLKVRVFGGWDFIAGDDKRSDYVDLGYEKGVPMGGELYSAKSGMKPSFIVAALMDPMGGTLDRVQMVKGWRDSKGELHERVYDIAWSDNRKPDSKTGKLPPVGNTVNVAEATWTNSIGDAQLTTVWQDPNFSSNEQAFYYVRVLEIPTPRWTCYDAKRFGVTMGEEVPMTTQERVYTSPIWYIPDSPAKK